MQSAIANRTSAIVLLLFAALPLAAGVSNITLQTYHDTITDAVARATENNVLQIATGIYQGNVVIATNGLVLLGGFDTDCATPVGGKPVIHTPLGTCVEVGYGAVCILSNLVMANAMNSGIFARDGAHVVCDLCVISNCFALYGGGVDVRFGAIVELQSSRVTENWAQYGGGGINADEGGTAIVSGAQCVIDRNRAPEGGGAYVQNGSLLVVRDRAIVHANQAGLRGGGIYVTNAMVKATDVAYIGWASGQQNTVTNGDGGGIFAIDGATVLVDGNSFVAGNDASGNGGGICLANATLDVSGGTVGMSSSGFTNFAGGNGGGVHAGSGSKVTIQNNSIVANGRAMASGGGIYASNAIVQVLSGSTIGNANPNNGNLASHYGGGVWAEDCMVTLANAKIIGNKALMNDGGGCHLEGVTSMIVTNTTFSGNTAGGFSGAIDVFTSPSYAATLVVLDVVLISNNVANYASGGGIGWYSTTTLVVRGSTIVDNRCQGSGGGIYVDTDGALLARDTLIVGNQADDDGGGICSLMPVEAINCSLRQNRAGTNGQGGGIKMLNQTLRLAAEGGVCEVVSNHAAMGGGVYLGYNAAATVAGISAPVRISGNTASQDGGGVAVRDNGSFNAINCRIEDNECTNGGGGIHVESGEAVLGADFGVPGAALGPPCVLANNRATATGGALNGGGMFARIAVADALVVSNMAGGGGAAHIVDGRLEMENATIAHNGGSHAVSATGSGKAHLLHCTIAANQGAGVQVAGVLGMTNCIVWGNSGTQVSGGGGSDVSFCDVQGGGMTGTDNIDADPLFAGAAVLDYQLTASSPCTNTGAPLAGIVTNDCIGIERPQLGGWDMGAYEFVPEPAATLFVIGCSLFVTRRKLNARRIQFI